MLFSKDSRVIAGRTVLPEQGVTIAIDPPLQVRNTVQSVALAVPGAAQWRKGPEAGTLLTAEGQVQRIEVELEAAGGKRYALGTVSFGKELMFSHVDPNAAPGASDLPQGERFTRLHLRARPPLAAEQLRWSDVTNK